MHPITAALEQSMSPDRIDQKRYMPTHRVKPLGFYEEDAILVGGVWYNARDGRKITRPVKVVGLRYGGPYHEFHPHPDAQETIL